MFTENHFEMKKTVSAIICTILFSGTLLLSAVGPAEAVDAAPMPALAAGHDTPLAIAPLA